ncbi:TPA: hypothetical protein N0F65_010117 [Lagenidium giganteum]|uniref:Uncharacterized protein n=1 Tax=Lagenidium giganteum TaxID=4803 RepID=A0AAV2YIN9_9STRA|nr:TPA: hypothetical protein N0F65_010117 [Lagenidium giganteum]
MICLLDAWIQTTQLKSKISCRSTSLSNPWATLTSFSGWKFSISVNVESSQAPSTVYSTKCHALRSRGSICGSKSATCWSRSATEA